MGRKQKPRATTEKDPPKEKEERPPCSLNGADWGGSEAKQLIVQDMLDELVPYKKPIKDYEDLFNRMYKGQPEFDNFPWDLQRYKDRIQRIQTFVRRLKWAADYDKAALKAAQERHGWPTHYPNGKPVWRGSEAAKQLEQDMVAGLCEGLYPSQVFAMHEALYEPFGLKRLTQRLDWYNEKKKPYGENPVQAAKRRAKRELHQQKKVKPRQQISRKGSKAVYNNK